MNLDFILWKMAHRKEISWKPAASSTGLRRWDTGFVRRGLQALAVTRAPSNLVRGHSEVSERKVPAPNWSSEPRRSGRWESSQSFHISPLKWLSISSPLSFVSCAFSAPSRHWIPRPLQPFRKTLSSTAFFSRGVGRCQRQPCQKRRRLGSVRIPRENGISRVYWCGGGWGESEGESQSEEFDGLLAFLPH